MKKGLTKEEHKKLGNKIRKIETRLWAVIKTIAKAYETGDEYKGDEYKSAFAVYSALVNLMRVMDRASSDDLRDMPTEEWIDNHFYL
jgi:hypothetical protein